MSSMMSDKNNYGSVGKGRITPTLETLSLRNDEETKQISRQPLSIVLKLDVPSYKTTRFNQKSPDLSPITQKNDISLPT